MLFRNCHYSLFISLFPPLVFLEADFNVSRVLTDDGATTMTFAGTMFVLPQFSFLFFSFFLFLIFSRLYFFFLLLCFYLFIYLFVCLLFFCSLIIFYFHDDYCLIGWLLWGCTGSMWRRSSFRTNRFFFSFFLSSFFFFFSVYCLIISFMRY
jgi:hypothetical protein